MAEMELMAHLVRSVRKEFPAYRELQAHRVLPVRADLQVQRVPQVQVVQPF